MFRRKLQFAGFVFGMGFTMVFSSCQEASETESMDVIEVVQGVRGTFALSRSASNITTAQKLKLHGRLIAAVDARISFPELNDSLGDWRVLHYQKNEPSLQQDDKLLYTFDLTLEPFLPGEVEVPAIAFLIEGDEVLATAPSIVEVTTLLPENKDQLEPKEVK